MGMGGTSDLDNEDLFCRFDTRRAFFVSPSILKTHFLRRYQQNQKSSYKSSDIVNPEEMMCSHCGTPWIEGKYRFSVTKTKANPNSIPNTIMIFTCQCCQRITRVKLHVKRIKKKPRLNIRDDSSKGSDRKRGSNKINDSRSSERVEVKKEETKLQPAQCPSESVFKSRKNCQHLQNLFKNASRKQSAVTEVKSKEVKPKSVLQQFLSSV